MRTHQERINQATIYRQLFSAVGFCVKAENSSNQEDNINQTMLRRKILSAVAKGIASIDAYTRNDKHLSESDFFQSMIDCSSEILGHAGPLLPKNTTE